MTAELEAILGKFDRVSKEADELLAGLSDTQLTWRPNPGTWSIGENLAHLNSIDGQDLPQLFREIKRGRDQSVTAPGPFRWNFLERMAIRAVSPPVRLRVKSPKKYLPASTFHVRETILEFQRTQNDMRFLIKQADGLDLKKIKVASPAAKWLKMSIGSRLELIAVHDLRHLYQARNLRNLPDFPKS